MGEKTTEFVSHPGSNDTSTISINSRNLSGNKDPRTVPPEAPEGWEWVLLPERPGGKDRAPDWRSPGETGHYSSLNPEPIQVWEAWGLDGLEFSMMKYGARYKAKGNPIQDLEKVKFYADRLIDREKRKVSRGE